jgi:hypothetical protein
MEEEHLNGILAYHQLHFPNNNALRYTIRSIRQLDPPPEIIAPLYGNLIRNEMIETVIDKLYQLKVGSDLLQVEGTPEQLELYLDAANDIIKVANLIFTKKKVLEKLAKNDGLDHLCKINEGNVVSIKNPPGRALEQLVRILSRDETEKLASQLKSEALKVVVSRKLPPIFLGTDSGETRTTIPKNIFKNE